MFKNVLSEGHYDRLRSCYPHTHADVYVATVTLVSDTCVNASTQQPISHPHRTRVHTIVYIPNKEEEEEEGALSQVK